MEPAFRGEHFDSSEFLLTRKHDGLAELRTELLVRLGELRLQLVNLINDEYQAFISLSTGLRGVKPNLDNLEFGDLLDVAQTVKLDLQRERERVGVLLEQRKGCRGTRDTLDVLRQIHHLLEGNTVKDSTTLVQLNYLLEQATPSKFTTVLSHRIDALRASLIKGLNEQLVRLLQLESKDPAELARLLETYTTINSDPTPLVITHLITPALAKLVTTTSLVPPSTLAALYDSLLSLSTSLHHTLPSSYHHLIWSSIATTLVDKLAPTLFQAGQPNQFHLHYSLSVSFIEQLGQSIPGVQETEEARAFMKRFQLMVYFQLRLKQIIQLVTSPSLPTSQSGEDQGEDFMLEESRQFWKGIRMIYDDSVHLPELGARFWRLFLQILSRYRGILIGATPRLGLPSAGSSANLSGLSVAPGSARASFDITSRSDRLIPSAASTRPGTPTGEEGQQSDEQMLRGFTGVLVDSGLMVRRVEKLWESTIKVLLPSPAAEEVTPREILEESLSLLRALQPALSTSILHILLSHSLDPLKHVKSVANQARASSSTRAVEPSYFVRLVFKDLRSFLGGIGGRVEEVERAHWAREVVRGVAVKYTTLVLRQKETDESLRRLKRGNRQTGGALSFFGRSASSTASGGKEKEGVKEEESEESKVNSQMQLDVLALEEEAKDVLRVEVQEVEEWAVLRRTVGLS